MFVMSKMLHGYKVRNSQSQLYRTGRNSWVHCRAFPSVFEIVGRILHTPRVLGTAMLVRGIDEAQNVSNRYLKLRVLVVYDALAILDLSVGTVVTSRAGLLVIHYPLDRLHMPL
jgi:hypothetical protein